MYIKKEERKNDELTRSRIIFAFHAVAEKNLMPRHIFFRRQELGKSKEMAMECLSVARIFITLGEK